VQLTHVRLLADGNFTETFRFYRDVLGLTVTFGDEESGYASFAGGGASLAIFERGEQAEVVELRGAGDGALPILEVASVDALAERLSEHLVGGPTSRPDWGIRVLYVRDPAGNLLELASPVPESE
jgi:lactoylglutathione lyase